MVTRSSGTSSARITNTVDGGGSSTVFSRRRRALRSEQVELVEDRAPCGAPRPGHSAATRMISSTCSVGDGGADPAGPRGRRGARRPAASRASRPAGSPVGSSSRAAKARAAWQLGAARRVRRTGRRGRDRPPRPSAGVDRRGLPDDAVPDRSQLTGRARSRTAAPNGVGDVLDRPAAVDHDPALRVGGGQPAEALRDSGVELGRRSARSGRAHAAACGGPAARRGRRGARRGRASTRRWPTR